MCAFVFYVRVWCVMGVTEDEGRGQRADARTRGLVKPYAFVATALVVGVVKV